MRWFRRTPAAPPDDVLDPYPGDALTSQLIICEWLRKWADDVEYIHRHGKFSAHAVFFAAFVSALRDVANEISAGRFLPGGDKWNDATTNPPHDPWPEHTETRNQP